MKINTSPVLTSKNYGINDIDIDEKTFDKSCDFCGTYAIAKDCNMYECSSTPTNPICDEATKQLKLSNSSMQFVLNKSSSEPIQIIVNFDKDNLNLIGKFEIVIKEDIKRDTIIKIENQNNQVFVNNFINVICEKNSQSNITILCDLDGSQNFQTIEINTKENAICNLNIIDFSSNLTAIKNTTNLVGENSQINSRIIYFASKNGLLDMNIINNIHAKNCRATIDAVGALSGAATKNFKGTIDFKNGAAKSYGSENELCLLLSENAKAKALPMLLCHEEDVDGSHSTATGKIDSKSLFYLMSRGLSKTDATKLIVKAKFNSILKNVTKDIQEHIINKIDRKLENDEQF